jgi:hypothetical protein
LRARGGGSAFAFAGSRASSGASREAAGWFEPRAAGTGRPDAGALDAGTGGDTAAASPGPDVCGTAGEPAALAEPSSANGRWCTVAGADASALRAE